MKVLAAIHNVVNRLSRQIPRWAWNAFALFFAGAFVYAALLVRNDTGGSTLVRFVAVGYVLIFLYAARRGDWRGLLWCGNLLRRYFWRGLLVTVIIGVLAAIFLPVFLRPHRGDLISASINQKECGLALLQYAQDYDEKLPPLMRTPDMPAYLSPYLPDENLLHDPKTGIPYVWRNDLRGLDIGTVNNCSEVIVAYQRFPISYDSYDGTGQWRSVLFLDGHVKATAEAKFVAALAVKPTYAKEPKP